MGKLNRRLGFWVMGLVALAIAYQFQGPARIAVGEKSADPFVEGFSFRESGPFGTFRWSGATARLAFFGIGERGGVLKIRFAAPLGHVLLRANDHLLTPAPIGDAAVQEYVFPIDRTWVGLAGDLTVSLQSTTFTAPPDMRQLGVQVLSASFEPQGGLVVPSPRTVIYALLALAVCLAIARAWTGSTGAAYGFGLVAVVGTGLGVARAPLQAAWLLQVVFWFGLALLGMGWLMIWLLRRFCTVDARTLRIVGLLCLGAFAVRLPFATTPGYAADVQDFLVWAYKVTRYGLASTYVFTDGLWNPNYPPVSLYAFQVLGHVYRRVFAPDFVYPATSGDPALRAVSSNIAVLADPVFRTLLRMPAVMADLVTGALIFVIARRKLAPERSFLIAAGYWFNPVVIYNSSAWGQIDALYTVFIVLAAALVETERAGWAFLALALGGLTKPQAFVFGPLLLLRAWQRQKRRGLLAATLGGSIGMVLVMAPMIAAGAGPSMIARFGDWIGDYPELSLNAHNFWWFLLHGSVATHDTAIAFAGLSYRTVGLLLFAFVYGLALIRLLRQPAADVWPVAAYVGLAFFFFPTEVHENYGFAVLALLACATVTETRFGLLYLAMTLTMLANYVLHDPGLIPRFGLAAPDTQLLNVRWANSAINALTFAMWTLGLLWAVVSRRRLAASSPGGGKTTGTPT
jgi:Gpi18-like mannosyltransferase